LQSTLCICCVSVKEWVSELVCAVCILSVSQCHVCVSQCVSQCHVCACERLTRLICTESCQSLSASECPCHVWVNVTSLSLLQIREHAPPPRALSLSLRENLRTQSVAGNRCDSASILVLRVRATDTSEFHKTLAPVCVCVRVCVCVCE